MKEENNYITYFENIVSKVAKQFPEYSEEQVRHVIATNIEYIKHLMLQDEVGNIDIPYLGNLYFNRGLGHLTRNTCRTEEEKDAYKKRSSWIEKEVDKKLAKNPKTKGRYRKSLHARKPFYLRLRKVMKKSFTCRLPYINFLDIYEKAAELQDKIHKEHN